MPDVGEEFTLLVKNGVLNYTLDAHADDADATVTMDPAVLDDLNLGVVTLDQAVADGDIAVEGEADKVAEFVGLLDSLDFWFEIVRS
ncbi:MAG: SCP2 sterol-binding domain-containing protein [Euzebyaceae bacterium]|nr:SCP2 sterol-binding domain-containing protein [Euzebyaceae bacterium]